MSRICIALERRPDFDRLLSQRLADHEMIWLFGLTASERLAALENADALLVSILKNELTVEEKALLNRVPLTQTISAGADQFDFAHLPSDALICTNVGGWSEGMAEHGLAMALAALRRFGDQKAAMARGDFHRDGWHLRTLKGKDVLIIGYGGIGRACLERFAAQGCPVSALSRRRPDDPRLAQTYDLNQLHQALSTADIVIVTAPANVQSERLFDAAALAAMKDDAVFINLSRSALVDHDALLARLTATPTFQAAIDPWWDEDKHWDGSDPLIGLSNVIASSHNSPITETAWLDALGAAVDNLERFLRGEPLLGRVNFADYERP